MTATHPFIRQIDHVGIYARDPRPLFSFFNDTLQLPTAFPYTEYAHYTSGSVALGNCFLEIMRFCSPRERAGGHNKADYFILGFLCKEGILATVLPELAKREVPHSGIVPFFDPEATDENPLQIWANVYLGRLLGENGWMRLFFAMTKRSKPSPSMMESPLFNAVGLWLMRRAFANGMPVLTEYYRQREAHERAISGDTLARHQGGVLGVERVEEITVAIREEAPWNRMLTPLTPDENGLYRPGGEPALRLLLATSPGIQMITLKVASLEQAREALGRLEITHAVDGRRLSFAAPNSKGLSIRLVA